MRRVVSKQSAQEIVDNIASLPEGTRLSILAPLFAAQGTYQAVFEEIRKAGFIRVRVDSKVYDLDEEINLDRYKIHNINAWLIAS